MAEFLRDLEQQLVVSRPWDAAAEHSIWSITGEYPGRRHSFTKCLAVVLPEYVTGVSGPVFVFVGVLAAVNDPVDPAWITHATPLLLVHRDDPSRPHREDDRVWLRPRASEESTDG